MRVWGIVDGLAADTMNGIVSQNAANTSRGS